MRRKGILLGPDCWIIDKK